MYSITKMASWKSCKSFYLYSSHHIFTCNNTSYIFCTFDISGSDAIRLMNLVIHATPSIMPSSMLMSRTCAPFSTCILAMFRASCKNKINRWISLHCKLVIGNIFLLPYESISNQFFFFISEYFVHSSKSSKVVYVLLHVLECKHNFCWQF